MNSVVMTYDDAETKLFRVLKTRTDCAELQRALVKNQEKEFNIHRCNNWADRGKKADITSQGMWNYINWDCSVEMSEQCYAMIQKANYLLEIIKK